MAEIDDEAGAAAIKYLREFVKLIEKTTEKYQHECYEATHAIDLLASMYQDYQDMIRYRPD